MRNSYVPGRVSRSALIGSTAMMLGLAVAAAAGGAANAQDDKTTVTEVVVTGSRIARKDFVASTPIVTVTSQTFENRATVGLENALNQLPQFAPAGTAFGLNASNVQAGATSSLGAATLSLRGLGPNRNLVLIDGRRPQPANASLVIDINSIPSAAVESVEVVTGGASATYGADAIAGVVNFKLKKNFEGFDFDAQYGVTQHGDGAEYQVSGVIGGNFGDDRGNALVGVSWSKRDPVYQRDRDFFVAGFNDLGTSGGFGRLGSYGFPMLSNFSFTSGHIVSPSQAAVDAVFATKGFAPGTVSASAPFGVNPDQTVFTPNPQNGNPAPGYTGPLLPRYKILTSGSDTGYLDQNVAIAEGLVSLPMTRYSMFSNAHYDINDHITAFSQGMYTGSKTETSLSAAPSVQFWGVDVPRDAAHPVPAQLALLLDSRSIGVDTTGKLANPIFGGAPLFFVNPATEPWALSQDTLAGPRHTIDTTHTYQITIGLRGDIPGMDWTWEAYGSHGQTTQLVDFDRGWVSQQKLQTIINAPNYGKGVSFNSGVANSTPGFEGTCTSGLYDAIFKAATPSQDCIDLMSIRMKSTLDLRQNIAEATVQGKLFDLPAGELRFAAGVDYREDTFEYLPDTNLDHSSIKQQPIGIFGSASAIGSTNVKEIYGELLVPVIKDVPFIQKLDLELGGRWSDYDTVGGKGTYKALGTWDMTDFLRLRGGYQLATRAPNIAELFTGPQQNVVGYTGDPCTSVFLGTYGVSAANTNATRRANAATVCHTLIDPVAGGYNPATYAGFFANGPFTIDRVEGNRNVGAETAKTWTVGVVLKSPATEGVFSRLTASVDWYNITINDAIQTATSDLSYQQCFDADGSSNKAFDTAGATGAALLAGNPLCANILREPGSGFARFAKAPYFNLGAIKTAGLDVQVDWRAELEDFGMGGMPGSISLNFVLNYLDSFKIQGSPGANFNEYKGSTGTVATGGPQFRYKTFTTLTYAGGPFNVGVRWSHLPKVKNGSVVTSPTLKIQGADAHDNFDLFAGWKISATYALRLGVDNLFDVDPEVVGFNPGVTNSSGITNGSYDTLGRRFYVGLKARF